MKNDVSRLLLFVLCITALAYLGCYGDDKTMASAYLGLHSSDGTGNSSGATDTTETTVTSAWPPAGFTEQTADQNTTFPDAMATAVSVSAPLPSSFGPHSTECDCVQFLRVKHVKGPVNPSNADRILIAQPGILEGAGTFYNIAANLVTRAYKEKGKFVEFWAIDRRPNCLEDLNGLRLAKSTGNIHDAIDYYYNKKAYNGKTFSGFLSPYKDAAWLAEMGMDQTIKDWNEIITRGIPDQSVRQKKVFLGGHSLGGFITGAYACWDFDGDATTTADAGYNQCAGFFGLDTLVAADPMAGFTSGLGISIDLGKILGDIPDAFVYLMREGLFMRYLSVTGIIDAEIMYLLMNIGAAADLSPTEESDFFDYMPESTSESLALRMYHSRDLGAFLSPTPTILMYRYTNQAMLGVFTDDTAQWIPIVRASFGFFTGGSITDKNFPIPSDLREALLEIPALESMMGMMRGDVAIASDSGSPYKKKDGPLYGWLNYNQIKGADIPLNSNGEPYTDSSKEVTDIKDFAFCLASCPMDFTEKYFPVRLALDCFLGSDGMMHEDGVSKRPVIDIEAGDGLNMGGDMTPAGSPVIPGYNHIDVITAAPVQNDGEPEKVTTNLLNFIFQ